MNLCISVKWVSGRNSSLYHKSVLSCQNSGIAWSKRQFESLYYHDNTLLLSKEDLQAYNVWKFSWLVSNAIYVIKTLAVGDAKIITKETTSGIFVEEAVIIWKSSVQKSTVYLNAYKI